MKTLALLLLAVFLTACGGGDPEDFVEDVPAPSGDERVRVPVKPDCTARPELCR